MAFVNNIEVIDSNKKPKFQQTADVDSAPMNGSMYPPKELFMGPLPQRQEQMYPVQVYPTNIPSPITPEGYDTNKVKYLGMSCIDVANHINVCPVCSKLHKSQASIYLSVIIFLIILCIFLGGKKFFE